MKLETGNLKLARVGSLKNRMIGGWGLEWFKRNPDERRIRFQVRVQMSNVQIRFGFFWFSYKVIALDWTCCYFFFARRNPAAEAIPNPKAINNSPAGHLHKGIPEKIKIPPKMYIITLMHPFKQLLLLVLWIGTPLRENPQWGHAPERKHFSRSHAHLIFRWQDKHCGAFLLIV